MNRGVERRENGNPKMGVVGWRALAVWTTCVATIVGPMSRAALAQPSSPIKLTPESAVALALEHNLALAAVRYGSEIAELGLQAAESAWTPAVTGQFVGGQAALPPAGAFDQSVSVLTQGQVASDLALIQRLPWGGSYSVGWTNSRLTSNSVTSRYSPAIGAGATATVVQPLLRGLTFDAVRAERAIRGRDRDLAQSELDAAVANTTRVVTYAYWRWVYLKDLLGVEQEALRLAERLLADNRMRVAAGAMAAVDVVEAEAEVARRGEAIIVTTKDVANAQELVSTLIFSPAAPEYGRPIEPDVTPTAVAPMPPSDAATRALTERQDLKDLRTAIAIDGLTERQYRSETLPDATLRVDYSLQGSGGTELLRSGGLGAPVTGTFQRGFGSVLDDVARLRYPTWSVQLAVGYPLGTSVAEANAARVRVEQRRKQTVVAALEQRIVTEVHSAEREVEANGKRLDSTATAVALAERRLSAEERKFTVGLSTSFFVFQAQRDLSSAREAQLRATLDHRLSVANLRAVQTVPLT